MESLPGEAGFLYEILTLCINLQHLLALLLPALCAFAVVLGGEEWIPETCSFSLDCCTDYLLAHGQSN